LDKNSQTRVLSVFEGAIYNGFFLITQGFLGTGLALEFGASEPVIALIGVLPSVSQFVQLIAPSILRAVGSRKRAMMICASAGRLSTVFIPVTLALGINRQSLLLVILSFFSLSAKSCGQFLGINHQRRCPLHRVCQVFQHEKRDIHNYKYAYNASVLIHS